MAETAPMTFADGSVATMTFANGTTITFGENGEPLEASDADESSGGLKSYYGSEI